MRVFAVDDPLPVHLHVTIDAALHSLAVAAKLASPPAEESYDTAWAPIGKKARPRLQLVIEQLRALNGHPSCGARVDHLRQSFQRIEQALATLEAASPENVVAAADGLKREVNATLDWLKLPAAQG